MKKKLKNIYGNYFEYEVQNATGGGVSVLEPGYIITPDGDFILVPKGVDHSKIFSDYLNKYLDNKADTIYESNEAMMALVKINHVVYYGLRMRDVVNIYNKGGNQDGVGMLILPENYKEILSTEQKKGIEILLDSNKSVFGNSEKMFLKIRETVSGVDLEKENFNLFLKNTEEQNERKN